MLELLCEHQLFAKLSKCLFTKDHINYLRHMISKDGVATDDEKITAMGNWPIPANATNLRGFLILTGFYRKFVLATRS